jgi:hypothetical protein
MALREALELARDRFVETPPSLQGRYEYRSDGSTISFDVWVEWPAFRLEMSMRGEDGSDAESMDPIVLVTLDGERFGVRDPRAGEPYVTDSLGEEAWLIGPVASYYGELDLCASEEVERPVELFGRDALLVRCSDGGYDTWVDRETGLVLRRLDLQPAPGQPRWSGFTEIEFDPAVSQELFEPASV